MSNVYPKHFDSLNFAAGFLLTLSEEERLKLKVRLHDNAEYMANMVMDSWKAAEQKPNQSSDWMKPASIHMVEPIKTGSVIEGRLSAGYVVNVQVAIDDKAYRTVRVLQSQKFGTPYVQPIEISCPSWGGGIEETKAFITALQKAVELAEERQVTN